MICRRKYRWLPVSVVGAAIFSASLAGPAQTSTSVFPAARPALETLCFLSRNRPLKPLATR